MTTPKFHTGAARGLYRRIAAEYERTTWEEALLVEAIKCLDRAEQARLAIGDELTVPTRGGEPKAHPLLLVERDARAAFARLMRQLGLEDARPDDVLSSSGTSFPRRRVRA